MNAKNMSESDMILSVNLVVPVHEMSAIELWIDYRLTFRIKDDEVCGKNCEWDAMWLFRYPKSMVS